MRCFRWLVDATLVEVGAVGEQDVIRINGRADECFCAEGELCIGGP